MVENLAGKPKITRKKYHSLTPAERQEMAASGFLKREIKDFDNNTETNFEGRYHQQMMRSRRRYVAALKANGWTDQEIVNRINKYLNKSGHSPWDFFRLEYGHIVQKGVLSRSHFAQLLEHRRAMSAHFGRAYARVQAVQPKYLTSLKGLPKKPQRPQRDIAVQA